MSTIVCIGDSLTRGMDWGYNSDLQRPLNVQLALRCPGVEVVNLGVNGDGSAGVYARRASADAYHPFRVIVWAGVNDTAALTALQIETNLQNTYDYFHSKNYQVFALTIPPVDIDPPAQNDVRNAVNEWIRNNSTLEKVVDAWVVIADPSNPSQRKTEYADPNTPVHINDAGIGAIVQLFF